MINIKYLFIFATTALATATPSSTVVPGHSPGFELILSDLKQLDQSVRVLTAAINAFQSGTAQATPIIQGVSYVNATNRNAYNDAKKIGAQNLADSQTIVNYVANPIAVDIPNSVKALNAKKEPLVNAGLRQQVLDGLNLLVGDHESLSAAIAEKLSPLTILPAADPVVTIDLAIRSVIANFMT